MLYDCFLGNMFVAMKMSDGAEETEAISFRPRLLASGLASVLTPACVCSTIAIASLLALGSHGLVGLMLMTMRIACMLAPELVFRFSGVEFNANNVPGYICSIYASICAVVKVIRNTPDG